MTVEVDPDLLRQAAGQTGQVRDRIGEVMGRLQTALAARGAPWGEDSLGRQFAQGDNGYLKAKMNMVTSAGQFEDTFDGYSKGQAKSADKLESMDRRNVHSYR